jgi:hypothetical protein
LLDFGLSKVTDDQREDSLAALRLSKELISQYKDDGVVSDIIKELDRLLAPEGTETIPDYPAVLAHAVSLFKSFNTDTMIYDGFRLRFVLC